MHWHCQRLKVPAAKSLLQGLSHVADERGSVQGADAGAGMRDLRVYLQSMRREVLQGCRITFSQVMDGPLKAQPQHSAFWQLATSLGATCCHDLDGPAAAGCSSAQPLAEGAAAEGGDVPASNSPSSGTGAKGGEAGHPSPRCGGEVAAKGRALHATHVVSLSRWTDKAKRAQERGGVALVSPDWLLASEIKCAHSGCRCTGHCTVQAFSIVRSCVAGQAYVLLKEVAWEFHSSLRDVS